MTTLKLNFLNNKTLLSTTFVLVAVLTTGCTVPGKVTGGGTIPGVNDGIANFGFNADSCEGFITGRFEFHDRDIVAYENGVKMNGEVTDAGKCTDQSTDGSVRNSYCETSYYENALGCFEGYVVDVNYKSTNPRYPGSGAAIACVIDNGEGVNSISSDAVWIHVSSGPYRDYYNKGSVQGNIQSHSCDI